MKRNTDKIPDCDAWKPEPKREKMSRGQGQFERSINNTSSY